MASLLNDLRHALRQIAQRPAFALATIVILALGIGASSAVFRVANSALLRGLPGVTKPDRLVTLYRIQANESYDNMSAPDYRDLREGARGVIELAAHCGASMALRAGDRPQRVVGDVVTGNYFD